MLRLSRPAAALALTVGAQTLKAQQPPTPDPLDPVEVDPANYKVVYEDDEARVIKFRDKPGYVGPIRDRPHPYVVCVSSPATRQFNTPDAAPRGQQIAAPTAPVARRGAAAEARPARSSRRAGRFGYHHWQLVN